MFNYNKRRKIIIVVGLAVIILGAYIASTWIAMLGWLITVFASNENELS